MKLKVRDIVWLPPMTLSGILCAGVTLYGTASAIGTDLRQNQILTGLYCVLPFLAFPVFILVKSARMSAAILAICACGYLIVFSALSWRTCSELRYCVSIAATVTEIFRTRTVLAYFAAALLRSIALFFESAKSG